MNLHEADITYKVRGKEFQFIKIVFNDEKENCTMKIQEVVFGDFKTAEIPLKPFLELIKKLDNCSIPFPVFSDGKSGDQHQLDIQSGENAIYLKWFGDGNNENWKDITLFTKALIELKNEYFQ